MAERLKREVADVVQHLHFYKSTVFSSTSVQIKAKMSALLQR